MLVGFLGADGMSAPTYAALLAAMGFTAIGEPATVFNISRESKFRIHAAARIANSIREVECGDDAESVLRSALRETKHVLVVVPPDSAASILTIENVAVLVVGPTAADEIAGLNVIGRSRHPISVLSWGLSDRSSSIELVADTFAREDCSILRAAIPALTRLETDNLLANRSSERLVRLGTRLVDALLSPPSRTVSYQSENHDGRGLLERLRDLADDLDSIARGIAPTLSDLDDSPVLHHWTEFHRPVPALAGFVSGHPTLGGLVRTSEAYASDGARPG
jgi:hypothetical protein